MVRLVLVGAGFDEAWTTTFLAPGDLERAGLDAAAVEVENPLDRSESILRTALLPGLLKAAKFNLDRQAEEVCLFEIGRIFALPSGDLPTPDEAEHLGVVISLAGRGSGGAAAEAAVRAWALVSDRLRLAGARLEAASLPGLHPGRSGRLVGGAGDHLGAVGEVDPGVVAAYGLSGRVGYLTVSLDALAAEARVPKLARDVSRYPASDLDLAFAVAEEVPALDVQGTLRRAGRDLLESVYLFDVFRGDRVGVGRRSLAFRLRYRAMDRTLGEGELVQLRQEAIEAVTTAHGGELRA
jgi:phenylalanyl-tRNA synthetase beta chain